MPTRVGSTKAGAAHRKRAARNGTATKRASSPKPKRGTESKTPIPCEPTRDDVNGCVTSAELSQVIESAFATLNGPSASRGNGQRQTPRIDVENAKPLLVVSYTHDGEEHQFGLRAELVDVSAGGLGIIVAKPIPVGATVRFALADEDGEPVFGYACVARAARRNRKHWLGVSFMDRADTLDIDESTEKLDRPARPSRAPRRLFARMQHRLGSMARSVLGGYRSTRTITRRDRDKQASFRIDVKRFRYQASLDVDGARVAFASWPLRSGSRNLFSNDPQRTSIQLEGDGFRATATIQRRLVVSCDLEAGTETSGQRFVQAPACDAALLNVDLGPPRGDGRE